MTNEQPVSCACCRKQAAAFVVKDNGFRTYPVCKKCLPEYAIRPEIVRKLKTA